MNSLPASRALEHYYLEARSKLLDLAAILDRVGRGENADLTESDARLAKIDKAIRVLLSDEPDKAALIQKIFSLEYDPNWNRPAPRK
jgi:hypothetical protein